jgi:hypothetical protein
MGLSIVLLGTGTCEQPHQALASISPFPRGSIGPSNSAFNFNFQISDQRKKK